MSGDHAAARSVARGLLKRGPSVEQILGVLGENTLRAIEVACE